MPGYTAWYGRRYMRVTREQSKASWEKLPLPDTYVLVGRKLFMGNYWATVEWPGGRVHFAGKDRAALKASAVRWAMDNLTERPYVL